MGYNEVTLSLVDLVSLIVVFMVFAFPLLAIIGYLTIEGEPSRSSIANKIAIAPFLILALNDATAPSYIQAGVALVVALILFLFRDHYDQRDRLKGEYVRFFILLTAAYWASSSLTLNGSKLTVTTSGFIAAIFFAVIAILIPKFFSLIAASSGFEEVEEPVKLSKQSEYVLEDVTPAPRPAPQRVAASLVAVHTAPPVAKKQKRYLPVDLIRSVATELDITAAANLRRGLTPIKAASLAAMTPPTVAVAQPAAVAPIPATVAPTTAAQPKANVEVPSVQATAVPQEAPPRPVVEVSEELPVPGIDDDPGAERLVRREIVDTEDRPAAAPAAAREKPVRPEGYEENDLSGFQLPTLPPRSAQPKPFKETIDPEALQTEQPKTKTSGVGFKLGQRYDRGSTEQE